MTLVRAAAAFALDRAKLDLLVAGREGGIEIQLTYSPTDGRLPFRQRRELHAFPQSGTRLAKQARGATDEMARNVALAFRPTQPGPPRGWSIHPAVASIVAAAGGALPNPADPFTWFERERGEILLPDGDNIANVRLTSREGVLLLENASIVNADREIVATFRMEGPRPVATFPGAYPETLADALTGRTADALCEVFATDPRGGGARIRSAITVSGKRPGMIVELADRLVPLLRSCPGGERWRPRKASGIVEPSSRDAHLRLLGHSSNAFARYYSHTARLQPVPPPRSLQTGPVAVSAQPRAITPRRNGALPKHAPASGAGGAPPACDSPPAGGAISA